MKKIFTLIIATTCAAILTSVAFGASIVIVPETTTPATDVTVTEGIYTNPESPLPDAITLKSAVDDFKNLSKAERKDRIKEAKAAIKEFKKEKREGKSTASGTNELLAIIFAILIPPVGVLIHEGHINNKFWIDLLLTLLFFLPGMIYALIVVLS